MTETCSAGTIAALDDNTWCVGQVLQSVKIVLKDWEEGGYLVSDKNRADVGMPRGEVKP